MSKIMDDDLYRKNNADIVKHKKAINKLYDELDGLTKEEQAPIYVEIDKVKSQMNKLKKENVELERDFLSTYAEINTLLKEYEKLNEYRFKIASSEPTRLYREEYIKQEDLFSSTSRPLDVAEFKYGNSNWWTLV